MPTQHPNIFAAFNEPFEAHELKTKPKDGGRGVVTFVSARVPMNRLDSVLGPENWKPEYSETRNGLRCRLWIRLPDGEWIWKEDGGAAAGMKANDDNEKSAYSDSFKRAAAAWGIGRYLYQDGVPDYSGEGGEAIKPDVTRVTSPARPNPSESPNGSRLAPAHRPEPPRREAAPPSNGHGNGHGNGQAFDRPPGTGKALFAWVKRQEEAHEVPLLKRLDAWAKEQGFPWKTSEWDGEQAAAGHAYLQTVLAEITPPGAEHESQEAPAEEPDDPNAGPITIRSGDKLSFMKKGIANMVRECVTRSMPGQTVTDAWVMQEIDNLSAHVNKGLAIGNLRDCEEIGLMSRVQSEARKWLEELKAMPEGI